MPAVQPASVSVPFRVGTNLVRKEGGLSRTQTSFVRVSVFGLGTTLRDGCHAHLPTLPIFFGPSAQVDHDLAPGLGVARHRERIVKALEGKVVADHRREVSAGEQIVLDLIEGQLVCRVGSKSHKLRSNPGPVKQSSTSNPMFG